MAKTETRTANLYINSKGAEASIKELAGDARHLYNEIRLLKPGTQEFIDKSAELKKVKSRLKEVNDETRNTQSAFGKIKNLLGPLSVAIGATFAISRITAFASESRKAAQEEAQALAQVEQAIKSTHAAAGHNLTELQKKATELQDTTLFGDETILKNATAQLLTFTNITGDNFLRTQKVALDLATVLSSDLVPSASELKGASLQLGKALNDPAKNLSQLSRAGIQFSDEQIKVIKHLQETNRLADAQAIILEELERQYGGQAEVAAEASDGMIQLGNAWGDFQEVVGGASSKLKPAITLLTDFVKLATLSLKGFNQIQEEAYKASNAEAIKADIEEIKEIAKGLTFLPEIEREKRAAELLKAQLETTITEASDIEKKGLNERIEFLNLKYIEVADNNNIRSEEELIAEAEKNKKLLKEQEKLHKDKAKELERFNETVDDLRRKGEINTMNSADREIAIITDKYDKILKDDLINEEQRKQLEEVRDLEIAAHRAEQDQKEKEHNEDRVAERTKVEDEIFQAVLDEHEAELKAAEKKYDELIKKAQKYGFDTIALEKSKAEVITEINIKYNEKVLSDEKKLAEARLKVQQDFSNGIRAILNILPDEWRAAKDALKAILIAEVIANSIAAAMSTYKAYSDMGKVGIVVGAVAAAGVLAMGGSYANDIAKLDTGGFTKPMKGVGADESGLRPAGIVHEGEWVAPPWMVDDPAYSNQIQMLEYARRNRMPGFDSGGSVPISSFNPNSAVPQLENITPALNEISDVLKQLSFTLNKGIIAVVDQNAVVDIDNALNDLDKLRMRSNL